MKNRVSAAAARTAQALPKSVGFKVGRSMDEIAMVAIGLFQGTVSGLSPKKQYQWRRGCLGVFLIPKKLLKLRSNFSPKEPSPFIRLSY